jgi:hypothetical protein
VRFPYLLPIANCRLPIFQKPRRASIKSAIGNVPETPKGGQSAQGPDRFFAKAADLTVKFFGSNASASNTPLT